MTIPTIGEIRRAKDIPDKFYCDPNTYYRYTSCTDCGKTWWASFNRHRIATRCRLCASTASRKTVHPINPNTPVLGEIRRGDEIGKSFVARYIWAICPECKMAKWIPYIKHNPRQQCVECSYKLRMIRHTKLITTPPIIGEIRMGRQIDKYKYASGRYCWLACPDCGLQRWVRIEKNTPRSGHCKHCKPHGANSQMWKGGTFFDSFGYRYLLLYKDDFFYMMGRPRGKSARSVQEHRLVMAKHLGRLLHPWEVVHHKNGIKHDNRIVNLEISTRHTHSTDHSKGYQDGYKKGYLDGKSKHFEEIKQQNEELLKHIKLLEFQLKELNGNGIENVSLGV